HRQAGVRRVKVGHHATPTPRPQWAACQRDLLWELDHARVAGGEGGGDRLCAGGAGGGDHHVRYGGRVRDDEGGGGARGGAGGTAAGGGGDFYQGVLADRAGAERPGVVAQA